MRPTLCTIDTSCIIALDHLDLIPQLSWLFSTVLIPKAVREDLFKRRNTKKRVQLYLETYAFIERCDDYEKGAVDLLLVDRMFQGMKDRGEVEAIVQAVQRGATVIVDDLWGRELAEKHDLNHHGTTWVLQRLFELGLMSSAKARSCFVSLRDRGTRLPKEAVDEFLLRIGEAPLFRKPEASCDNLI